MFHRRLTTVSPDAGPGGDIAPSSTLLHISLLIVLSWVAGSAGQPEAGLNLRLTAPIQTWDEAIPLGNGALGVLLWGEGHTLRCSLDRGDLWDERPSRRFLEVRDRFTWETMQQLVASNRMAEFNDIFDSNYDYEGPPTKLPAGREMLLQSWSAKPGRGETGVIRLFPATPWRWHDAHFNDWRAEGGHRVSAIRENNATTWFRIVAGRAGTVKIRDNFEGREPKWNRPGVSRVGDAFEVVLKRGETLEATLPKPASIPPAPGNAAAPVVIGTRSATPSKPLSLRLGADGHGNLEIAQDLCLDGLEDLMHSP